MPAWRLSRASGRHDGRQGGRELRGTRNSVNSRFLLTRCISYPPELDFVAKAENIVFIGPTGVGKTGLATGLLLKALQSA